MAEGAATSREAGEDRLLGGAVRLLQPRRGHRAGTDAVLLANLVPVGDHDRVVDLGAASGAVGLIVAARRAGACIVFVERDPSLTELCRRNVELNGVGGRAAVVERDIFALDRASLPPEAAFGSADLVLTNPPFFQAGERPSPEPGRRSAHVMSGGDLALWLKIAAAWLKPRARLGLVHRADQLGVLLDALSDGFGSATVRTIHPRVGNEASRVVVTAVKAGRTPLRILPPLVLHGEGSAFTPEAARLHAAPMP